MMGPRAIIQGATKADQQRELSYISSKLSLINYFIVGQADWAKKVWSSGGIEIADAQKVKLVLSAWDPVLRYVLTYDYTRLNI